MKLNKLFGALYIVLGVLMAIGPWTFARICTGAEMKGEILCKDMRADAMILGLLLVIGGILLFLVGQKLIDLLLSAAITAGGFCGVLIPTVWAKGCGEKGMACHDQTMPFLLLISILTFLTGILAIYMYVPKKKKTGAGDAPSGKGKKGKAEEPQKTTKEKVEEAADAEAEVVEAVEAEIVEEGAEAADEAADDVEIVSEAEEVVVEDKA